MVKPTPPGVTAVFNGDTVQAKDTNDPQPPENNWINGDAALKLAPKPLSVITGRLLLAINLYHTSADPLLPQEGKLPHVGEAFNKVPDVFEQEVAVVSVMAPVQSSFAGGVIKVTQILKFATVPAPEGLVFKLAIRT